MSPKINICLVCLLAYFRTLSAIITKYRYLKQKKLHKAESSTIRTFLLVRTMSILWRFICMYNKTESVLDVRPCLHFSREHQLLFFSSDYFTCGNIAWRNIFSKTSILHFKFKWTLIMPVQIS